MTLDPATLAFVTSLVCATQLIALIVLGNAMYFAQKRCKAVAP
jgi:hypothetical protein